MRYFYGCGGRTRTCGLRVMSMASFFFYVQMGLFSAGGGYDTIALIQNQMAGLVDDTAGLQTNGKGKAEVGA